MSSVLLSFTSLCFGVFRIHIVFVVTSCQGWLGLCISSDREGAVWFFCSTVIRPTPTPSLVCKCDAKNLKVLSPMIKDSSLSVAIRCLIRAPTEQRVQPEEKTRLSPKRGSTFYIIQFPPTPEQDVEFHFSFLTNILSFLNLNCYLNF